MTSDDLVLNGVIEDAEFKFVICFAQNNDPGVQNSKVLKELITMTKLAFNMF